MYSRRCWNIPRARIPLWWKCYFPQIVWFTVNEFSLPIIIWRSFRSPPDHRGLCCRKHERKYLEISAFFPPYPSPEPVNGGNYQLIKGTWNYNSYCHSTKTETWKKWKLEWGEEKVDNCQNTVLENLFLHFASYPDDTCDLPNNCCTSRWSGLIAKNGCTGTSFLQEAASSRSPVLFANMITIVHLEDRPLCPLNKVR